MKHVFDKGKSWVSDYIYHEDINWRPDRVRNKTLSKLQVIDAFDEGFITYSDLYIVYVVHVMTFANLYHITEYTKWWKRYNKEIPLNPAENVEEFRNRVEALLEKSFLRRYKITNSLGIDRDYYYVTPHGYNFIKRKLYHTGFYDEYLGAAPVQEVLKYLSNNEILLKVLENVSAENGYHMESKSVYASHTQFYDKATRKNITTYGFLNIKTDDKKVKVLIEPYRPTFDKAKYASGQMEVLEKERFEFLERYINAFNMKNVGSGSGSLKVVFVAEDLASAKKLSKKLLRYDTHVRNNMLVTVDKTISEHGLENTFMKVITKEDGSPGLGLGSLEIK